MAETGINDEVGVDISDGLSHALSTEEIEHHHIHDGVAFRASKVFSLTNGATVYLQIKTGANVTHFKQMGLSLDANTIVVTILEKPVVTDGSTALAAINCNRNSAIVSTNKLFTDPTSVSGGTTIDTDMIAAGSTSGTRSGGVLIPAAVEFDLKPNTNYVIVMTNQGTSTSQLMMKLFWYELQGPLS